MATPIEIIGLVHIGITTVCSTITGLKANTDLYRSLTSLINETDKKAQNVEECISSLSELGGIQCLEASFFQRALAEIREIQSQLSDVQDEINRTRPLKRFIIASSLSEKLRNVNETLGQLFRDLKLVRMFGDLLCKVVGASRDHICAALNRTLIPSVDEQAALSIIQDLRKVENQGDFQLGVRDPASQLLAGEDKSVMHFLTGKAYYEGDGPISRNYNLASQHLLAAFSNGTKEAAFYLGMMFYHGRGVEMNYKRAFNYFSIGVKIGHTESIARIASCYWLGRGTAVDEQKSLECTIRAAELGSPNAMRIYGFYLLHGFHGVQQDWPKAFELVQRAQLGGEPWANIDLAKCYAHGIVVERDPAKAFKYWSAAYNCGVLVAVEFIARCYEQGFGVEQDLEQAAQLYKKVPTPTAEDPFTYHLPFYGMCLVRGQGVGRNVRLGFKLIKQSTIDRAAPGWFVLGECYRHGFGVEVDIAKAIEYYMKGCKSVFGSYAITSCEMALAEMFEKGEGLACNMREAARHYKKAADLMNTTAQWKMGTFYESGTGGLEINTHISLGYFEKAARSGHTQAFRKAGLIYMKGIGIQQDRSKGKRLLREAIERGDDASLRLLRSERIWRVFRFRLRDLNRRNSF